LPLRQQNLCKTFPRNNQNRAVLKFATIHSGGRPATNASAIALKRSCQGYVAAVKPGVCSAEPWASRVNLHPTLKPKEVQGEQRAALPLANVLSRWMFYRAALTPAHRWISHVCCPRA
jgi:hypothetical protein